jgi:CDP-diacylglycerol--glycerol-3-phosphate 3-phosphatidyltransferase
MSLIPAVVRRGFEASLEPLVRALIAARVSPNAITTVGTAILVLSAAAFGMGAVRTGGFLLLLSGVMDMLDGRVARGGGGATKFGAFYDSTLDRVGESALFGGIAVYFVAGGTAPRWEIGALVVTLVALTAGLIVSYARARAEGLDLECKVGVAQRAERVLGLGAPSLLFGAGPNGLLLLAVVSLLAVLAVVTVVQRVLHVRAATRGTHRVTRPRWVAPAMVDSLTKKGTGGD